MSTNTAVATSKKGEINTVRDALEKMKPQFALALPKHITPERLLRVAMTAIQTTPKLLDCDRQSLYSAIMKAAQLGLEPDGILGQAYLIPYGKQVQFIPGYKGLIDLARRSGEVSNIIAKEVCEKDKFSITWQQQPPFVHEQQPSGDRGKVIGFWALANFKDGGFHWDYMTVEEIAAIRNGSSGWQSAVKYGKQKDSPWEKNFIEMGKKTAIRRIAKFLPMSVQRAAVVDEMQESGKNTSINDYGEIVIDHNDGNVIEGEATEVESSGSGKSKLDDFASADTETANQNVEAAAQSDIPTPDEKPAIELTLIGWQKELNAAVTVEDVQEKSAKALMQFAGDGVAVNAINTTAGKRLAALKKEAAVDMDRVTRHDTAA